MEINEEEGGSRQLPTLISLRRLLRQSNPKSRPVCRLTSVVWLYLLVCVCAKYH